MNPLRPTDWEKRAFRAGVGGAVFALVVGLLATGFDWLIWGKKTGEDLFGFAVFMFGAMYFNEAISGVHERLSEISEAVRRRDGRMDS